MDDEMLNLRVRHSLCVQESLKHSHDNRSDSNLIAKETGKTSLRCPINSDVTFSIKARGEYYKSYEYDLVPVRDSNARKYIKDDDENSLTNSELEKLETKVFKNISQELQSEDKSIGSLESNIKFFKTTVQKIFDNFYNNMKDYEQYKKRFQEILAKSQEESVAEMEDFINDMIHHIMSSDTSVADISNGGSSGLQDKGTNVTDISDSTSTGFTNERVVEAYKNDNYLTDSTLEDVKTKRVDTEEKFNIFLLSVTPGFEIRMHGRNLLSEINIKSENCIEDHIASAEDLKKVAAKKLEVQRYLKRQRDVEIPDKEIPVKNSFAKKNIHLNEDFVFNEYKDSKSFIVKLCNFLCRRFRKNSLG